MTRWGTRRCATLAVAALTIAACSGSGSNADESGSTESRTSASSGEAPTTAPAESTEVADAEQTAATPAPATDSPSDTNTAESADDVAVDTGVVPVDFTTSPFITFAPVPPKPAGSDLPTPDGADDYWELFEPGAAWQNTLDRLDAFKVHSWMIRHYFSDDDLRRIDTFLREHEIPLIVEAEPLDPPDPAECQHSESFEGPYEIENAVRLRDLGVQVGAYVIEQPFSYGHKLDTPGSCQYTLDRVIAEVVGWADDLRAVYPDIPIGSIEALWERPQTQPEDFAIWIDAWTEAMGEPPAFQHVDVNWAIPDWPERLLAIEQVVEATGVPFGPLYNGHGVTGNDAWVAATMDHIAEYESGVGGTPDHITIQSWNPQPDRLLPDDDETAMTHLVNRWAGTRPTFDQLQVGTGDDVLAVSGRLVDTGDSPVGGLDVEVVRPVGASDRQEFVIDELVPPGADQALVIVRVNTENSIDADANATVHDISVSFDGGANVVPDGAMTNAATWNIYDDNVASGGIVDDGDDGALLLRADPTQYVAMDGQFFDIPEADGFRFEIAASLAHGDPHGTIAIAWFRDGGEFVRTAIDLIGSPVVATTVTTAADGTFTAELPGNVDTADVTVRTRGDATTWPASARTG